MTAIETSPPPTTPDDRGPEAPRKRRRIALIVAWTVVALAILILAESWISRGVIAAAVLVGFGLYRSPLRPIVPILVSVASVAAILYMVGSYSWLLDLAAVATAAIVVALITMVWRRIRRRGSPAAPTPRRPMAIALGFVLAWWLAVTAADTIVMRQAARRDWGTNASLCPDSLTRPDWGSLRAPRVAMAVSGGGYRAALFHAGVLAGLGCIHVPVTALSTVSGGSIIGAYYAVGGEPHAFRSMVTAGLFNVKRELLHVDNALRFAGSLLKDLIGRDHPDTRFTQTDVQASLLDRLLYRGLRMADLDSLGDPRLLVNVTDLVSSERIAISARGVLQPFSYDPVNRQIGRASWRERV